MSLVGAETSGPKFVKQERREQYPHILTETMSLTDRVFQDSSGMQLPVCDYKFQNPLSVLRIPHEDEVVAEYSEMIQEHMERRFLFFFQQLIVCYQTKLHFECSGAQDQGLSADKIQLSEHGKVKELCQRNAAHSSTLPCLIAYDNTQWQQYRVGLARQPDGFVFLKGTDYYRTANATMNMPKWMNEADRELDEKTQYSLLRQKGLTLLNEAAQGLLNPDEGIALFVQHALDEIQSALNRLNSAGKHPAVQTVLSLYLQYATEFQKGMDRSFLERFLNITFAPDTTHIEGRYILQTRYAAIRNMQVQQANLIEKIDKVRKDICASIKATNQLERQPTYFKEAFRTLLIEQARTDQDRQRLEKLYNFSHAFVQETLALNPSQFAKFTNIKKNLSDHYVAKINDIAREVLLDMRHLRIQEETSRAQIIKDLRGVKQWQQWRLGQEIKQRFPHAAASQATICRIETGQKLVTPSIAKEFSQVFKIDPGLFMPQFCYE